MKMKIIAALTGLLMLLASSTGFTAETNGVKADLKDLIARINQKLHAEKKSESDLAGELKEFDTLLATHQGASAEDLAQVLAMKAGLYLQVLDQPGKAAEVFKQIKKDYPQSQTGQRVDDLLAMIAQQAETKKIQDSLAIGKPFPDFDEVDLNGKPLSIAHLKGKVVLLDFWATWCGPCRIELPNVLEVYQKHHQDGFEIIGVSLDEEKPRLESFLKDKSMTWPQYFDGQKWKNKLAVKYGVNSIPATYLLDGEGKLIAKNIRGQELEKAVAGALKKK